MLAVHVMILSHVCMQPQEWKNQLRKNSYRKYVLFTSQSWHHYKLRKLSFKTFNQWVATNIFWSAGRELWEIFPLSLLLSATAKWSNAHSLCSYLLFKHEMASALPQYTQNPLAKILHATTVLAYILEQLSEKKKQHKKKIPTTKKTHKPKTNAVFI